MFSSVYLDSLMESIYRHLIRQGVDDISIIGSRTTKKIIKFHNNSLSIVKSYDISSLKIYIGYMKRRFVTNINIVDEEKVKQEIDKLLSLAKKFSEIKDYVPLPSGYVDYHEPRGIFNESIFETKHAVDLLKNTIDNTVGKTISRVAGTLEVTGIKKMVKTSGGRFGEFRKSLVKLNMRSFAKNDASYQVNCIGVRFEDIPFDKLPEDIKYWLKYLQSKEKISYGKYNVIMAPLVVANLAGYYSRMASAYYVDAGLSPLKDCIGEEVVSETLNIYDNPILDRSPGAIPFDEEAVPTRKTYIFKEGVMKTYLHNTYTAHKFKTESTGHAGIIVPAPHTVLIDGGRDNLDELIKDLKNGLFITNTWYTRFQNYVTGDFSTLPRDLIFIIRNGDISGYTYNIRISDNIMNIFKNIISMSKEEYWIYWWDTPYISRVPYVSIENVNISCVF